jgi:hypothetical protein
MNFFVNWNFRDIATSLQNIIIGDNFIDQKEDEIEHSPIRFTVKCYNNQPRMLSNKRKSDESLYDERKRLIPSDFLPTCYARFLSRVIDASLKIPILENIRSKLEEISKTISNGNIQNAEILTMLASCILKYSDQGAHLAALCCDCSLGKVLGKILYYHPDNIAVIRETIKLLSSILDQDWENFGEEEMLQNTLELLTEVLEVLILDAETESLAPAVACSLCDGAVTLMISKRYVGGDDERVERFCKARWHLFLLKLLRSTDQEVLSLASEAMYVMLSTKPRECKKELLEMGAIDLLKEVILKSQSDALQPNYGVKLGAYAEEALRILQEAETG